MKSEQNGQQFGWSLEQQFVRDVNWTTECCYVCCCTYVRETVETVVY